MASTKRPRSTRTEHVPQAHMPRLPVLDGWRAISILCILQCHLGAYGSAVTNEATDSFGILGMALFFCLSGFLITSALYFNPSVRVFLIRRVFRIVPAAWLYLLLTLPLVVPPVTWHGWVANLIFFTNHVPYYFVPYHRHMWSLAVEVQFYAILAVLFFLLRRKTFALLPVLGVVITLLRIHYRQDFNIRTEYIGDEIASGATLAYLFRSPKAVWTRKALARIPPVVPLALLAFSSTGNAGLIWLGFGRPYWAALLLGATLCRPEGRWTSALSSPVLGYIASISYALYLWHAMIPWGQMLGPNSWQGYLCRMPLSLALLLGVAHVSTFYVERPFLRWGNRLAAQVETHDAERAAA